MKRFPSSLILCTALAAASACHAALIDNRSGPNVAEIEAMYKRVSVDDLVAGLVPQTYTVQYQDPQVRMLKTSVIGRGAWNVLLDRGLAGAGLRSMVDTQSNTVRIMTSAQAAAPAAAPVTSQGSGPVRAPAAPQVVYRAEIADAFVSRTVARWAAMSNMQLVWEPKDVDYPIKADSTLGTDIRTALGKLFGALQGAATPLRACIHQNEPRNVIRVIRAGDKCKGAA